MARRAHFNTAELDKLIADLSAAPLRVRWNGEKALMRGMRLIDRQMARDAKGHMGNWFGKPGTEYVTPMDRHVSHELTGELQGEVGIEYKGAGKLAHIIVHGSVNNPPTYDYMANPRRIFPRVVSIMAEAAEESVLGDDA